MLKKSLIAVFILTILIAGLASAGPDLDKILNYMFMDENVPLVHSGLLFDVQREIMVTKDNPVGQTFTTGPNTHIVAIICVYFAYTNNWQEGEAAEVTLWDSPGKNVKLGSYILPYEQRSFKFHQSEWDINAPVKPNTTYYFEITYAGNGDGELGRVGVMNGSDNCKSGQGYLNGAESDFDLCFQIRARRAPDPAGNLKKMFARLDLTRPELAEVKQAVEKEDFEMAIAKTVAYFEQRQEPFAIIRPGDIAKQNPQYDTKEADSLMNAAWRQVDMEGFGGRRTFCHAYMNTGDEKYAKKLNDLLIDFYINCPAPSESNIGGTPWDGHWASLSVGLRIAHGFVAYSLIHGAKSFTTDCRLAYLISLADHCNTLVKYGVHAGGNWSFTQNSSMLTFSMNFPEFKESAIWRQNATERLMEALQQDILPDGVEMESAPSYQLMAYNPLARGVYDDLIVKRGLDTPFAAELGKILERQAEYFMYLPMPNGVTPMLGDWAHDNMRGAIMEDSKRFKRSDMVYVATGGKDGTKPKELSKLYPYAGIVTMRSDWGDAGRPFEDARYILLHGVHFGGHGHQDINGISGLYAYGRELLTDPGAHEYGSEEHRNLSSAKSHNLMTIDGEDQDRTAETAFKNWSTTPIADYLSSYVAAYEGGDYTREVFFVRTNGVPGAKDYWIVRDTAEGSGTHALEQTWRFVFETPMELDKETQTTRTAYETGGNLAILQVDPSRLKMRRMNTNTYLWRGDDKGPSPLPTVAYSRDAALPTAIDTVLFPFEGKELPQMKLETLEKSRNGLNSAFKMVQGKIEDLFALQESARVKWIASENVSFDGEKLFIRKVGGKLHSALLINGSSLTVNGERIIEMSKPLPWIAVTLQPSGAVVYTSSQPSGLTVPVAKGGKFKLNVTNANSILKPPAKGSGQLLLERK
ncbi:MAG: heparinase II/III family protein [Armatimonadota bacterium]|nr:heparinase II/III family protein [Armatimonadota bacterium]